MSNKNLLEQIYYQPGNLWKGKKAIKELQRLSGLSRKEITQWISRQAFWQVHLPAPKKIDFPHFRVTEVNKIHQADLLHLPHDKVYQNIYKYSLDMIDVASRFKAARPLKSKRAEEVADMIKDIYKKGPLKWPQKFHCDNGSEFKSSVDKLLKEHNVEVKRVTTKYQP